MYIFRFSGFGLAGENQGLKGLFGVRAPPAGFRGSHVYLTIFTWRFGGTI